MKVWITPQCTDSRPSTARTCWSWAAGASGFIHLVPGQRFSFSIHHPLDVCFQLTPPSLAPVTPHCRGNITSSNPGCGDDVSCKISDAVTRRTSTPNLGLRSPRKSKYLQQYLSAGPAGRARSLTPPPVWNSLFGTQLVLVANIVCRRGLADARNGSPALCF